MEPAPKRARAEASPLDSPLSEGLLLPSAQDVVRERYTAAHPYSYAVIERLCDAERMALIKQEITQCLPGQDFLIALLYRFEQSRKPCFFWKAGQQSLAKAVNGHDP